MTTPTDRQAAFCDWLRSNKINPRDVPFDPDITVEDSSDGTRLIRYEAFVLDENELPTFDQGDRTVTKTRTTPLLADPPSWWRPRVTPDRDEALLLLDSAYRERAHLVALLAAMTPGAVITPALDIDERGWQIAYLTIGGRQASWHISPRDADLFAHVEHVQVDDPRAQWDGHTTGEKYAQIAAYTARLAAGG